MRFTVEIHEQVTECRVFAIDADSAASAARAAAALWLNAGEQQNPPITEIEDRFYSVQSADDGTIAEFTTEIEDDI